MESAQISGPMNELFFVCPACEKRMFHEPGYDQNLFVCNGCGVRLTFGWMDSHELLGWYWKFQNFHFVFEAKEDLIRAGKLRAFQ